MADDLKGKIEEVRAEEAKIRKGFVAWAAKINPAAWAAIALIAIVVVIVLAVRLSAQ